MKKILFCTLAGVLALFLSACQSAHTDIGVIGGADGPTVVLSGGEIVGGEDDPAALISSNGNDSAALLANGGDNSTAPEKDSASDSDITDTPAPDSGMKDSPTPTPAAKNTPAPTAAAKSSPTPTPAPKSPSTPESSTGGSGNSQMDAKVQAVEMAKYEKFLNQNDVYGFLLSSYSTPLDADYAQVFYDGAGMTMTPSQKKVEAYLKDTGLEELYTDITFISAKNMDALIQKRTGYTLKDVLARGNPLSEYLDRDGDFALMHGDTNRIRVNVISVTHLSDGAVLVESCEGGWNMDSDSYEDYDGPSFFTTLRETDGDPLIVSNSMEGGWMEAELESSITTLKKPPFDGHGTKAPEHETLPVTLDLRSVQKNNVSTVSDWIAENWMKWRNEPSFSGLGDSDGLQLLDANGRHYFEIYGGQYLDIYERDGDPNADLSASLRLTDTLDFENYLYPEGHSVFAAGDDLEGLDAQEPRWAMLDRGELIVSNFHPTYASTSGGKNAYLTCVDLDSGAAIWRSEPLVCNSDNFVLLGVETDAGIAEGVILCGYGFTDEDDYLYQISRDSGRILDRTPVASKPDRLVYAGGVLYVHCYDRDYEFDVSFG